ncbi:MAG: linear amide C-N hydrolase [Duncaniella sp.]|nr:linear amide C-N hydrolase [Duncaniella sp.]HBI58804.1 choloylglycine hydrolase [Porphyromonadaceae bacterium]
MKKFLLLPLMLIATLLGAESAMSCSRILYVGNDSLRIVGRSLDWKTPIPTNLYVYPRGITKKSHNIPGAFEWTSRYGAIYAVGYDGGITEGMNEKGLVINGLFCKGTVYDNAETSSLPPMSLAVFIGWLLDLNATTPEVVEVLRKHDFNISGETFDGGTVSTLHWGATDSQGRCAIFEFDHGDINIYEGTDMRAMTNDPSYPQMTAINNYWDKIGGAHMLPGTVSSPDRFVRGDFFDRHVAKTGDADLGVSIIRSILMNLSVPYTYLIEGEPNVSSTQWRSFANVRDIRYYFDIVTHPGLFYIDLNKCDLRPGAPIMKIDNEKSTDYIGDVTNRLEKSEPFTPMY